MRSDPGTYALLLQCDIQVSVQIGRLRQINLTRGFYTYVGSAFGPGGVKARISRHLRRRKTRHWHIDYLRDYARPVEVWTSYEPRRLEHEWAQALFDTPGVTPFRGFGCSDCKCPSHLFHTLAKPEPTVFTEVEEFYCWAEYMPVRTFAVRKSKGE